jgi:uncharacterized protein (TIGR00369 family)
MATMLELGQKILRGELLPPPIARLLGFAMKSVEPGHAVFEMEVGERNYNPMGTLHGGIYCDLADAAMGFAYAATLGEGETFTTIELKINFLRAVREATLTAEARVVKPVAPWATSSAMSRTRPAGWSPARQARASN